MIAELTPPRVPSHPSEWFPRAAREACAV